MIEGASNHGEKENRYEIKDVLRLKFEVGLSHRDIGQCLSLGPSTVSEILSRFKSSDMSWPEALNGKKLEAELYNSGQVQRQKRLPDFMLMQQELKRKGMTKLNRHQFSSHIMTLFWS